MKLQPSAWGNALNHRQSDAARFVLTGVAIAAACLWGTQAWALGLGRLTVTSALGETLRAEIDITSITAEEASSLKLRVAPADAYLAAGVEYNAVLPSAQVQVVKRPDGRSGVRITSDRAVLEPFVDVIIEATWSSGRLVREYTMLFDPPSARTAQAAAPATAPVITPVPAPANAPINAPANVPPAAPAPMAAAPSASPSASPSAAPVRATPRRATTETPRPPVAGAAPTGDDEVRVLPGDSLSRIAGRTQRPGISLDQMLVSLFRSNPQAFMGGNMNRLKAGAVLSVPSAEQAGQLGTQQARDLIVAQSADFAAYRQRLATGTTTEADAASSRQARGQVQTQVDDRKQAAAPTPDRLKLSQGGLKASSPEVQASKQTQTRDDRARLAELARNVDDLKKLQGAGVPGAPAAPPPVVVAPTSTPTPTPTQTQTQTPSPGPVVVAAAPPAPAVTPAAAPVPTPPAASAARPAVAPAAPPAREEPGFIDSLLDN